jgi:nitrite reductase/ring-hydroxylating ferredoxin subunit
MATTTDVSLRFFAKDGADKRSFAISKSRLSYEQLVLMSGKKPPLRIVVSPTHEVVVSSLKAHDSPELLRNLEWRTTIQYEVLHFEDSSGVEEGCDPFVKVAELHELELPKTSTGVSKKKLNVGGRHILLYRLSATEYSSLDATCYHMGGPLVQGDIEEFDGRLCVTCPWHRYKIDIKTGEGLYTKLGGEAVSKGPKQRKHQVEVRENGVFVRLSVTEQKMESDHYAYIDELKRIKQ